MVSVISREANILSQLTHPAVCFLIGVQIQQKPYYLITSLYEVSITLHNLLFPDNITDSGKKGALFSHYILNLMLVCGSVSLCKLLRV